MHIKQIINLKKVKSESETWNLGQIFNQLNQFTVILCSTRLHREIFPPLNILNNFIFAHLGHFLKSFAHFCYMLPSQGADCPDHASFWSSSSSG